MASIINASSSGAGGLISTGDSSGVLQIQTNTATTATFDASGNVGIGGTSTTGKLEVFAQDAIRIKGYQPLQTWIDTNDANKGVRISTASAIMGFSNDTTGGGTYTERMRIDSSGNLLVGKTTSAGSTVGCLAAASGLLGATADSTYAFNFRRNSSTGIFGYFNYNGSDVGTISTTGANCLYNSISDYRLKEHVAPMVGALDKVALLKPVTYKWKIDGSDGQGFIAHELQEVVPDCVTGEKDAVDAEGKPVYQGIDTSVLVATLTAAIQEQQTIINDLKTRIIALEGAK